jgi:2-dehydro-3-deoxyphosphogluconate aldolase / (4S)-4-hydroxy-2-oxoglutarate aldolase
MISAAGRESDSSDSGRGDMNEVLEKLGEIGAVPVVCIENATSAVALGRFLVEGDLPVAEIAFRTAAAELAICRLTKEVPELLVGAGTVLTTEQADRAADAGARFIVSPGFNARVVDHCLARGIPIAPGW